MVLPLMKVSRLSHHYGDYRALAETNFTLTDGEIVVLTGPNGAGKTTLLLCLSGLLRPSTGQILLEEYDLYLHESEAKRRLAFVPDVPRFYMELTAWEHLKFIAFAHSADTGFEQRAETLLKELGLWQSRDLFPQNYSRGMRLKLGLAMALIRPFRVLLLDEPTSALDREGVDLVRSKLIELRDQGAAILLSSHDLTLSKDLADHSWTMQNGRLEVE